MQRLRRHLFGALLLVLAVANAGAQEASKEVQVAEAIVYSIAFSPDGKVLATSDFNGAIKLSEFPDLKEKLKIAAHAPQAVYCVTFNRQGDMLASSGLDKS